MSIKMEKKIRIGITSEYMDKYNNFMVKGPGLKLLAQIPDVEYEILKAEELPEGLTEEEIVRRQMNYKITEAAIAGFDMIITMWSIWDQSAVLNNDRLLSIHRHGAGYEQVNIGDMTNLGILVCTNSVGVRRPVATATMAFLLALDTRMQLKIKMAREGDWINKRYNEGYGLRNKVLGLVGLGHIGREILKLASPFEMKHIAYDPYISKVQDALNVKLVDMDTLLKEADYLVLCCTLNDTTYHLISTEQLQKMKKTAFLINMSRGPVIDEPALIVALKSKAIRGAGIDVFEKEPTPVDNPLLHMENVIATPHCLGWTEESFMGIWDGIVTQIKSIIDGKMPDGVINKEVWDSPKFKRKLEKMQGR
jgi:phosphoglycerate dehydrogenase-like enzyme